MTFTEALINIAISIVSSLTIWTFLQLYTFGVRKKIHHNLALMRDECVAFEKYLKYSDYDNALQMTRRILDKVCQTEELIKPLTYFRKKRLLINTFLSSLYNICYRFTQKEIGYSSIVEKEACCEKTLREVYSVGFEMGENETTYPDPLRFEPQTSITAKVLIELNMHRWRNVTYILNHGDFFNSLHGDYVFKRRYLKDLVDVDVFKGSVDDKILERYYLTSCILTQKEYNEIIDKIVY